MRKIFLSIFSVCFLCACAHSYGHLKSISEYGRERFLVDTVLRSGAISYCLAMPEKSALINEDDLHTHIAAALKDWTYGVTLRIKKAGRGSEFKDFIHAFENVEIKKMSSCNLTAHNAFMNIYPNYSNHKTDADISFIFSQKYCKGHYGKLNAFYYDMQDKAPFICLIEDSINMLDYAIIAPQHLPPTLEKGEDKLVYKIKDTFDEIINTSYKANTQEELWLVNRRFFYDDEATYFSVIMHEAAHAFGLADQYPRAQNSDPRFSSAVAGEGLMRYSYGMFTCDELDGILSLYYRFKGGSFTRFCDGKAVKDGVEVN